MFKFLTDHTAGKIFLNVETNYHEKDSSYTKAEIW